MPSPCHPAPEVYAQRWGRLVELEAAASAVEGNDSRLLFDVPITWGEKDGARRLRGVEGAIKRFSGLSRGIEILHFETLSSGSVTLQFLFTLGIFL